MRYPNRLLRLERLETRDVPSDLRGDAPPSPPPPDSGIIDPTMDPSNPTSTTVAVMILAVSQPTPSGDYNVTVSGLSASNLQPGTSLQLLLQNTTYSVIAYSVNHDNSVTLTVMNGSGLAEALAHATTASVVVGNGGTTPPPAETTTSSSSVIDPTLDGQGR